MSRSRSRERDRLLSAEAHAITPFGAHLVDLGIGIARFAQYLGAVLADIGGAVRLHLVLYLDPDRAVDRHRLAVSERHQRLARQHLTILRNVFHFGDNAEDDAGSLEDRPPFGEIFRF
jgi:hypothetical protein